MLNGLEIDSVIIGSPAYESMLVEKGDVIIQIDRTPVRSEDVQLRLEGADIPGSSIILTLRKKSGRTVDVSLKRTSSSIIADRCRMVDMFALCKVRLFFELAPIH